MFSLFDNNTEDNLLQKFLLTKIGNNTFAFNGIGSGFKETNNIPPFLCSKEFSIDNSFTFKAFFRAS